MHILQELHAKGVDLFLHQQGLDTSTPSGRAMFQMLGVFAEFERAMIRERVMAGLTRAKAEGTRLGRPATVADDAVKVRTIRAARAAGKSIRAIAREHGIELEVVKLPDAKRGFVLLPRRWVVERSFAWTTRFRRLVKDYERYASTLADLHVIAFACLMLRKVAQLAAGS